MSQSGQEGRSRDTVNDRITARGEHLLHQRATSEPRAGTRRSVWREARKLAPLAPTMACVILTAGHRNATNGGAPGEMERTPRFARAYRDAFRAAGYTAFYIQEMDDDGNPDSFAGGLSAVAARVRAIADGITDRPVVMLDLHLEEGDAPRGVFTIVPDDPTGASTDVWKNNTAAVTLGHLIAEKIAGRAGFTQRQAKELGV